MGLDAGPDAGNFEPVPMIVYDVTYGTNDVGASVAKAVKGAQICKPYFCFAKTWGRETTDQAQAKGTRTFNVYIRRYRLSDLIQLNMIAVINGVDYGITDIQPAKFNQGLLVLTMTSELTS